MDSLTLIISLVTLGGVLVGIVVNISNMVNKREQKAAADARIEVKLDALSSDIKTIGSRMDGLDKTVQQHGERITKVEESAKSAHHRLDEHIKAGN